MTKLCVARAWGQVACERHPRPSATMGKTRSWPGPPLRPTSWKPTLRLQLFGSVRKGAGRGTLCWASSLTYVSQSSIDRPIRGQAQLAGVDVSFGLVVSMASHALCQSGSKLLAMTLISRQIRASACSNAAQRPPVHGELVGFDAVTRLQEMKGKKIRLGQ